MSNDTPLDRVLQEKHAAATVRQEKEMGLWKQWKASGSPEHLEPLLDLYNPIIKRKAVEYGAGAVMIPPLALESHLGRIAIEAFQTYDPNRGASLNTHVHTRMQKAKRYVVQHQNAAYIPEGPAGQIGAIERARDALTEEFGGRAPTVTEIAGHLRMPVKTVSRIQRSIRRDVPASSLTTDEVDNGMHLGPREAEVLSLLPSSLTPDEHEVFSLIYHPDLSQRVTSTTDLARRLGKAPSRISRLKSSILTKAKDAL